MANTLKLVKKEETGVICDDNNWDLLAQTFLGMAGEDVETMDLEFDEDNDDWDDLRESNEDLYHALVNLCDSNGGVITIAKE